MRPVRLIAYSDYLCPWCFNASVRLHRLEDEFGGALEVEWRSYLLRRPQPDSQRTLEKFRIYTQSWLKPAAEPDSGTFRVWSTDNGPPSHSVPPHLVAKAAATYGRDVFRRMHEKLLLAYFAENRDITAAATLQALWVEVGLPAAEFTRVSDPIHLQTVIEEHNEAIRVGLNGVPAVRAEDNDTPAMGAFPMDTYRRWVRKLLAAADTAS